LSVYIFTIIIASDIFTERGGARFTNVASAGGLQSQGVKGEAVVFYFEPLTTQNLKSSGVPEG